MLVYQSFKLFLNTKTERKQMKNTRISLHHVRKVPSLVQRETAPDEGNRHVSMKNGNHLKIL